MANPHDCILCSIREKCPAGAVTLFAVTPILGEIVAGHLNDLGAQFEREGDLFVLPAGGGPGERTELIQTLRERLSDAERADIRVSIEGGAALLAAPSLEAFQRYLDTAWFEEAVRADRFTTHFQPVVEAGGGAPRLFAHECLIRLQVDKDYSGAEVIEAAISRGSVHLFDSYARRLSVRQAAAQPHRGTKLFINFMASSIYAPEFCMASTLEEIARTDLRPEDIVFEVVESDYVTDIKHLARVCDFFRKQGLGFAMDDVGSGANSLQNVCELKPDFIKLDKSLIAEIAQPMYNTAVRKVTEFAHHHGVEVIAEGVETAEIRDALQAMGIRYMQGYFFGRPAPTMAASLPPGSR